MSTRRLGRLRMPNARIWYACLLGVFFQPLPAQAHHSAAAAFTTNIIEVEGRVVEFNFSNPHVNITFDVTDENGKTVRWTATDSAATLLRRQGWTSQTIEPGQYLRITGRSTRDGSPMVLVQRIAELDPKDGSLVRVVRGESDYREPVGAKLPLKLADGRPNLTGAWTMGPGPEGRRPRAGGPPPGGRFAGGPPPGGPRGGPRRGPPSMGPPPPYNELGRAMQAKFDPISDPAVHCEDPGLVRQAAATPHPVRITQEADRVIFEYEEYGGRRVVYLDGRQSSSDAPSKLGRSVGHYDGDTLVVESTGLLENYTSPLGNPLSNETTTVETYRRADDPDIGAAVEMQMVITDPKYLTAPWTVGWKKYYSPGYEFIKVDCRVPSTYRPPQE